MNDEDVTNLSSEVWHFDLENWSIFNFLDAAMSLKELLQAVKRAKPLQI